MSLFRVWWVRQGSSDPFASLPPLERYVYWTLALGVYSTALPGLTHCGRAALQEATALPDDDFGAVIAGLERRGVLWADAPKRIYFLPSVLDATIPQGPNSIGPWRRALDELPDSDLKVRIDQQVRAFLVRYGEANPAKRKDDPAPNTVAYILTWDPTYRPADPSRTDVDTVPKGSPTPSEGVPKGIPQGKGKGRGSEQGLAAGSGLGLGLGSEPGSEPGSEMGWGDRKVGKEGFGKPSEGNLGTQLEPPVPALNGTPRPEGGDGFKALAEISPAVIQATGRPRKSRPQILGVGECRNCKQGVVRGADGQRYEIDGVTPHVCHEQATGATH